MFAVVSSLTHFSNITLSSLYFDVNKDSLYADALQSDVRRAVVAVLWEVHRATPSEPIEADFIIWQILDVMTRVMSPIVPHLSEEVHDVRTNGSGLSVFALRWETTVSSNYLTSTVPKGLQCGIWRDDEAKNDLEQLAAVRNVVLDLLEQGRRQK